MVVVETIGRIRREYCVKGKSIKQIARELQLSRNTVRKVLRSGATSFEYMRAVQPRPKLGAWHGDLDRMLSDNEARPARERLTLIRVFEELRGLGYEGSYDAVRRYAKKWRIERGAATAEAYVPLSFAPGEAYQFDWSHEVVVINGTTVTVKVAHLRLGPAECCSCAPIRARQRWCFVHNRAFAFFKGPASRHLRQHEDGR
jgi:transposase